MSYEPVRRWKKKFDSRLESIKMHPNQEGQSLHLVTKLYEKKKKSITKTCLYNFAPLKPHFYIVKLGFTGVYIIFLISAQKHRLWVLVRTASPRRF